MHEHLGQLQSLGQGECSFERCGGLVAVAADGAHAAELGQRRRQLPAGLALFELGDRLLEPGYRLLQPAFGEIGLGERGAGTGGGLPLACFAVERDGAFEPFPRLEGPVCPGCQPAGLLEQRRLEQRVRGRGRPGRSSAALVGGAE